MSYDINIYDASFLRRAFEQHLGDWRNADPLPAVAIADFIARASLEGFVLDALDPQFVAFSREQGSELGREFTLDTPTHLAQLHVFPGEVAFLIPYSDRAERSIELCVSLGKEVAAKHRLAYYDPQNDDVILEWPSS